MFNGSKSKHIRSRRGQTFQTTTRKLKGCDLRIVIAVACAGIITLYVHYARSIVNKAHAETSAAVALLRKHPHLEHANEQISRHAKASSNHDPNDANRSNSKKLYQDWKALAVDLAARPADEILSVLETQDPFGVRRFEKHLLEAESARGAFLTSEQLQELFPCPADRITLPDQRDRTKENAFRDPKNRTYLFFQHLRKAGGTNFCSLAQDNLPRSAVASYFCMPDMAWSGKRRCAGCLNAYTNAEIDNNMHAKGHRILGNEWDAFDPSRYFALDAIFATSFRKPLDRALSQFRFECIEDRGCTLKTVEEFWTKEKELTNVYTWTFSSRGVRKISVSNTKEAASARQEVMEIALDVVARFHLVLVMEWLTYATKEVETILGFHDTSALTRRVRPHIATAKREDGQEKNVLGAAGITKASWDPKEYLSPQQYKIMSENLALDEILTDAARRMFLERLVCKDVL
jgi:hypothetical protein